MNTENEEENKYPRLKSMLEEGFDDQELFLTDYEREQIVGAVQRDLAHEQHRGYFEERCNHNPREKAFRDHWLKENDPRAGVNHGNGILQDLFIAVDNKSPLFSRRYLELIQPRDCAIVATAIQWLGTNVGWCFLEETMKDCGYHIMNRERSDEIHKEMHDLRKQVEVEKMLVRDKDLYIENLQEKVKILDRVMNEKSDEAQKFYDELQQYKNESAHVLRKSGDLWYDANGWEYSQTDRHPFMCSKTAMGDEK